MFLIIFSFFHFLPILLMFSFFHVCDLFSVGGPEGFGHIYIYICLFLTILLIFFFFLHFSVLFMSVIVHGKGVLADSLNHLNL